MSWFSKNILHPAVNALAALSANPVVQNNPDVHAAVAQAKQSATVVASTATEAAHQVAASAAANVDPVLGAVGDGLTAVVDAYLMNLGLPGELETPVVNAFIAMGRQYVQAYVDGLFTQALGIHHDAVSAKAAAPATAPAPEHPAA